MKECIIKVNKLDIYYMKKVDSDGNVYRILIDRDKGLVSNIQYWCTDLKGNLEFFINDCNYKIECDDITCIPVDNYRSLQSLRKKMLYNCPFYKWEHLIKYKPDMVLIERQNKLDVNGNMVYHMRYFKDGENVTSHFKFWRLMKGTYERVNCYVTDKWFKDRFDNQNLVIKREERI